MSLRELLARIAGRWYVVVGCVLLGVAAFFSLSSSGGSYVTKPIIAFTLPGSFIVASDNGIEVEGVIAFASAVAQSINNGKPVERYAAEDAPLYGAGATDEVRIGVPNVGGQWGTSFTRAEIAISIVGQNEQWVETTRDAMIENVLAAAAAEQDARGVPDGERIDAYVLPLSTEVETVASSAAQRGMAGGALMVASLLVGGWLATLLDRGVFRYRARAAR